MEECSRSVSRPFVTNVAYYKSDVLTYHARHLSFPLRSIYEAVPSPEEIILATDHDAKKYRLILDWQDVGFRSLCCGVKVIG